jgi:heavy metal sensor kinase
VQWESGSLPPVSSVPPPRIVARRPTTIEKYRVVQEQLKDTDPRLYWLRVGSSLAPVQDDVAKLTNTMLIAGAVVLLVSPLGGYWLAGRATRPLARIIDTTARLHPSNLEERLQIRGTRDELDRLSQTVNALLDRIAAYITQNRQFTANAAHELRSPLAAIQNSLEVGLNADRSADEYHELLGETLEECGVLRDLVNQMLLLAESDAGRLEISPDAFRLEQVAQKSHEMFVGVAEAADLKLQLDCPEPVLVYGNASRLRQVVNNLVDNAIKFSRPDGTITVSVRREHGRHAVLEVVDTGTGITEEDLPHVFERFYRGDKSRQRKDRSGGTGLGLSICRSIVIAHSGTIKVESTLGQRTAFTVTLPLAEAARRDEIGLPLKNIESSTAA